MLLVNDKRSYPGRGIYVKADARKKKQAIRLGL